MFDLPLCCVTVVEKSPFPTKFYKTVVFWSFIYFTFWKRTFILSAHLLFTVSESSSACVNMPKSISYVNWIENDGILLFEVMPRITDGSVKSITTNILFLNKIWRKCGQCHLWALNKIHIRTTVFECSHYLCSNTLKYFVSGSIAITDDNGYYTIASSNFMTTCNKLIYFQIELRCVCCRSMK